MFRSLGPLLLLVAACELPDLEVPPHLLDADDDGFTANEDCDDDDPLVHPDAEDACDGFDNDCDGFEDNAFDVTGGDPFWADDDGDGFGDPAKAVTACFLHDGYAANADDCDDDDPNVKPGVADPCNGVDDDCDNVHDEDAPGVMWRDADADGYGDPLQAWCQSSAPPTAHVSNADDCDDADSLTNPGAPERCAPGDNDCNGTVDDDPIDAFTMCLDSDDDGLGDPTVTQSVCLDPGGDWVFDCTDCEDDDVDVGGPLTWYADTDGDDWGDAATTSMACEEPAGPPDWVLDPGDCDVDDGDVNPDEDEVCRNQTDDDCDPVTDCRFPITRRVAGGGTQPDVRIDGDIATQRVAVRLFSGDLDGDAFHETFIVRDPVVGPAEVVVVRGSGTRRSGVTSLEAAAAAVFDDVAEASTLFGSAVATVDDLDGDDLREVLIGDPQANDVGAELFTGTAYVYYSDTGIAVADPSGVKYGTRWLPNVRFQGEGAGARFGARVVPAPGARGDEHAFLVSSPGVDGNDGAVYLIRLGAHAYDSGVQANTPIDEVGYAEKWSGPLGEATEFGTGLAFFRDHLGRASVAVGARFDPDLDEPGNYTDGAVYIFRVPDGTATPGPEDASDAAVIILGFAGSGGAFGTNVANVGDVNGDGVDDIGVSAPVYTAGDVTHRGKVYVLSGAIPDGTQVRVDQIPQHFIGGFIGPQGDAEFGATLASGDVDGDGFSDFLFGAPMNDTLLADAGAAWLVYGRSASFGVVTLGDSGLSGGTLFYTALADNEFGRGLTCGDVDGDGFFDVTIGAPGFDPPTVIGQDAGGAFLTYGSGQ